MRDGQVYAMQEANARRSGLILGQFTFLETRQRAFEIVCKSSTLWKRLRFFWNPQYFMDDVDAVQMILLEDSKKKMAAASEKAKEDAAKPKLTIVGASGPAGVVSVGR